MSRLLHGLVGRTVQWAMTSSANRFRKQARDADRVAEQTLQEILRLNGATEWGRRHGLDGPHGREAFQAMALTSYPDYLPYVERVAAGEPGILTGEPVTYFAVTSGTTGPQKLIPVTRRQTRTIMSNMLVPMGSAIQAGLLSRGGGRTLQLMTEQVSGQTAGGIPKGAATSGGLRSMGRFTDFVWTSPMSVIQIQEQAASRYLHLLFALGEEHLWSIVSFFPATLLFALRDLQARAGELLRDLADGTISPELELPGSVRAELAGRLRPDRARARALSRLWEHGRLTVREIWPEVGAVLTAGSGTFGFYLNQLQPFLGGVPVFSPVYASSEAAIGIGLSPDQPGYVLSPGAAYHEFLPVEDSDRPDARPLALSQVEPGSEYELVLTTYAGLTRYRLGDVVRVLGRCGQAPIIEFLERRGQVINIVGEKTNEAQIARAVAAACTEVQVPLTDYVVTPDPDTTPARYLLVLEGLPLGGVLPTRAELERLVAAADRHLSEEAPEYGASRRMGELAPAGLLLLKPGAFERYRETRVAAGASASQVKVPHVLPDPSVAGRYFRHEALVAGETEKVG